MSGGYLATVAEMRALEAAAIATSTPEPRLMENAGAAIASANATAWRACSSDPTPIRRLSFSTSRAVSDALIATPGGGSPARTSGARRPYRRW